MERCLLAVKNQNSGWGGQNAAIGGMHVFQPCSAPASTSAAEFKEKRETQ